MRRIAATLLIAGLCGCAAPKYVPDTPYSKPPDEVLVAYMKFKGACDHYGLDERQCSDLFESVYEAEPTQRIALEDRTYRPAGSYVPCGTNLCRTGFQGDGQGNVAESPEVPVYIVVDGVRYDYELRID